MPLCSISGGSDIISCFFLANPLLPIYRGELQGAGLGMNMKVFNEQGESVLDEKGELVCVTPFPSMPVCFWSDHDGARYQAAYFDRFPDVWAHGDYALIHPTLSAIIFGRSDATLNPGGVRIGTSEIYAVLAMIEEVVESVAVGQSWNNDERIVLFVVLKEGVKLSKELVQTIKETLRVKLSPKHVPAVVLEVPELPKTVNGKLVEIVVKNIVNGQEVGNTSTLENPACLEAFKNRAELN
jgi:acetoacetyl-CoA synthetase